MSIKEYTHSSAYFGKQRDFWWNRDFLDLMAQRWDLGSVNILADIGCGLGHWSRLLFRYLKPGARVVGIDREPRWVEQAPVLFKRDYPEIASEHITFIEGDATELPLANNHFDLVTCQTMLIHLSDPALGLAEMIRITKPGGLVLCVEPNNFINRIAYNSLTETCSIEDLVIQFEFWLRHHRGTIALGLGNECTGELLPGLMAAAGLRDIAVYISDKPDPLYPPYDTPEQQAILEQDEEWWKTRTGPWEVARARGHLMAGGGTDEQFRSVWEKMGLNFIAEREAIAGSLFHTSGGSLNYIVSGKKF